MICSLCKKKSSFKGGHLDFSQLIKLKYIYITEIYMKKNNHKITKKKKYFGVFP